MLTPIEDLFALAQEAIAPVIWNEKKALQKFKEAATPEKLLEVAKAFRALEQENILLKQGCENNPLVHEMIDWRERAEAAEAKLAGLDKQRNPDYFLNRIESSDKWGPEVELRIYESQLDASKSQDDHGGGIIELFTRPALAADLAEMCDRQYIAGLQAGFRLGDAGDSEGLLKATANYRQQIIDSRQSITCAATMRNIEEAK